MFYFTAPERYPNNTSVHCVSIQRQSKHEAGVPFEVASTLEAHNDHSIAILTSVSICSTLDYELALETSHSILRLRAITFFASHICNHLKFSTHQCKLSLPALSEHYSLSNGPFIAAEYDLR